MTTCRTDDMHEKMTSSRNFYGDLEDYVCEMENQQARNNSSSDCDDIYAQLARKEKDLILAAELGKALLEKNEEISRANERLTEEYSQQLEIVNSPKKNIIERNVHLKTVPGEKYTGKLLSHSSQAKNYVDFFQLLEQEKHGLRRKLEALEGEYDSRISELQSDIDELKKELEEQQALVRAAEKGKCEVIREMTEQNLRLNTQLKQAARTEEQLQAQLQTLREQFNVRKSNLHDHVSQLEGLREEINLLEGRKADLEQRIQGLMDERENLNLSLEESGDRIILLQRQNRDQEQKIRNQQQDLDDLRQSNTQLQQKLDLVLRRSPNGNSSLLDEIEMSAPSSMEEESTRFQNRPPDDIECDDLVLPLSGLFPEGDENMKHLAQEVVDIYQQLRRLCLELRRRRDNVSVDSGISTTTPEEIQAHQVRVGMFTNLLQEFRSLMEDLLTQGSDVPCLACQTVAEETETLERLQKEVQVKTDELKKKTEEISQLTTKLTIQETELAALREERDHLRHDVDSSNWAKDEIVKKAWTMRDQAVARKNAVEIALAKTRIELMHINGQLMEAVQQKVELSQQLDQWQLDMQALLDEQMKKKLKNYEQEERRHGGRGQAHKRAATRGKLFKLFR